MLNIDSKSQNIFRNFLVKNYLVRLVRIFLNTQIYSKISISISISRLIFWTIFLLSPVFSKIYENSSWKTITTRAQKRIQQEKAKNLNVNEPQEKVDEHFSFKSSVKKPRGRPRKNLVTNLKSIPSQTERKRGRPRKQIYENELPEINLQKGNRTKVESDSDSDLDYSDFSKQTQVKNKKKKNAKKPKNINGFESERSENYFSTLGDEINDIETSHEGNDVENYEECLEENFEDDLEDNFKKNFEQNFNENFEDNLEENFEETFEKNQEENLEEKFEDPHFKENLKRNRRSQINSAKNDNDHDDYNRPLPVPPPINSQTEKIITRKNLVECRDQLTMRKDNYAYFVTTNGTLRDNGSKTLEKRETLPKFGNLQKGIAKEIEKENYYHFALPI